MSKLKKLTETHGQKKKENSIVVEISMARVSYIKHNYTIFYVSQFVFFLILLFFQITISSRKTTLFLHERII